MALTKIDDRGLKTPIDLLDNEKIRFGDLTTPDLEIYHDGTNSFITNSTNDLTINSTGDDLILKAADDAVIQVQGSENAVLCNGNGAVQLFYDAGTYSDPKLETTANGSKVTGQLQVYNQDDANHNVLECYNDNDTPKVSGGFSQNSDGDGTIFAKYKDSENNMQFGVMLKADGDSYITGGNVGIGTTSPSTALDVSGEVSVPINNVIRWRDGTTTKLDMYTTAAGVLITRTTGGGEIYRLDASGNVTIPGGMYLDADDKYMYLGADQDAWVGHTGASAQIVNSTGWLFIGNGTESNDAPIYIRSHNSYNQITCFSTEDSNRPGEVALCAGATGTERLTTASYGIYVNGNVKVPSGNGIDFSATSGTGTSELLDDYEEGTFTPSISSTSRSGTITYTNQVGFYTKIGNRVFAQVYMHFSGGTNSSNAFVVDGLPFANVSTTSWEGGGYHTYMGGLFSAEADRVNEPWVGLGLTYVKFHTHNGSQVLGTQTSTGANYLIFHVQYVTA